MTEPTPSMISFFLFVVGVSIGWLIGYVHGRDNRR